MRSLCLALAVVTLLAGGWLATAQDKPADRGLRPTLKAQPAKAAQPSGSEALRLDSALVTIIEEVEVPARDVGQLEKIEVIEGQLVAEGDLVARIEDKDVELLRDKAKIEAEIAREESQNDAKVRGARKSAEVAASELRRAEDSIEKYRNSVPAAELDRLQLAAQRATIDVEQSEHELRVARLTLQLKENEFALAEHNVARRRIVAPLAGMVVQIHRRAGEWVQPGEKVVRVLRLNRLRVEAFLTREEVEAQGELVGRSATLTVSIAGKPHDFAGKLVFVHPEINPVNGKVRVWAEVENRDLLLRPGMHGTLSVTRASNSVAVK